MVNKTSSSFSPPLHLIAPYLTPRVIIISLVALGAISAIAYLIRQAISSHPVTPPASPRQPTAHESPSVSFKRNREIIAASLLTISTQVSQTTHFKENVQAIIDFPEDQFAEISSFEDGILDRADKIFGRFEREDGTTLDGTVETIKGVFFKASSFFEETLTAAKEKLESEDKIQFLLPLSEALTQETALLEGVGRIQRVYQERNKRRDSAGRQTLNDLYENRKEANQLHLQQYQKLIQTLQKELPPLKTADLSATDFRISNQTLTPEAKRSLAAYCRLYCPGIFLNQAEDMIMKGQILLREILKGKGKPATELKESQEQLAQITWFLTYCALKKGQAAGELSFAIEEDSKLYEFLQKSPAAYQRMSNHYVGRSPANDHNDGYVLESSVHLGVDVHNGLMPAQKRTILFGLVDNFESKTQVLFFKPDNFGTRESQDLLTYAPTLFQKQNSDEKVPDPIIEAFVKLTNHIRKYFREDYESLRWEYPFNVQAYKHTMEYANLWGIAYMYAFIQSIKSQESRPDDFDAQAAHLEATWALLDHPDKRTGREIYLSADDLRKFVLTNL